MNIGKRIQEARKKAGMKQSDLAERLGVAVITIGQYERGKRKPNLGQLQDIAKVLNADIVYLISGQTSAEVQDGIITQMEEEARTELKKLQSEARARSFDESDALNRTIIKIFEQLSEFNLNGYNKATKRLDEIAEIPSCRRQEPPTAPPAPSKGTDTPQGQDAPEGPTEPPEDV